MILRCLYTLLFLLIGSVTMSQEDIISNKKKDDSADKKEAIITNSQGDKSLNSKEDIISNNQEGESINSKEDIISNNPKEASENNQKVIIANTQEKSIPIIPKDDQSNCTCWDLMFSLSDTAYFSAFSNMENSFIEKKYLDSSNSDSYLKLMKVIADSNNYFLLGVDIDPMLILGFKKCFLLNTCDSSLFQKIQKMNQKMATYEEISPRLAFTDLQKIITKDDLENKLIRHYVLTFYSAAFFSSFEVNELKEENEITDKTEKEEIKSISKHNILNVYAAAEDKVYVNDSLVKLKNLKKIIYKHISDTNKTENSPEIYEKYIEGLGMRKVSKQSISFTTDDKTSYEYSVMVKDEIKEAYNDRRNEISDAEFGTTYDELIAHKKDNLGKIRVIHNLLSVKITEIEASE